ncbi:MAG: hypothetical protein Q7R95_07155 [bacterium]|nr:hypothetical protein [bacterium]
MVRKINYDDFTGLTKNIIKKHFKQIKKELDPGKKILLEYVLFNKKP